MFKYTIPKLMLLSEKPSHGRDCPAGSGDCSPTGTSAIEGNCQTTGITATLICDAGGTASEGCTGGSIGIS